ncbi:glycosyltransferase [Kocuria rhizophila]|uniref:glycosyltransferase n=1 Tax=Kocuria rhizophila TaxID=72000 RepID=UPI0021A8C3C0|nr:glycosyltransferase [Kocuria rhizophila]MCT2249974.1 glycosyltransferase [Kocuria rhizophila]
MAMNSHQVAKRKAKVNRLIQGLEKTQDRASADHGWFTSESFRAAVNRNDVARLAPVRTPEDVEQILSSNGRAEIVDELVRAAQTLPDHAGSRTLTPHPARVAMIADAFLFETFEHTADITYLTPENFRTVAKNSDVLVIASTWRGRFEDWHGTSTAGGLVRTEVIPAFRANRVPIVFYSKEDPPNYVRFRPLAAEADVVFTSAQEMIPAYQADCPEVRAVNSLTFGVNPYLHTPVGSRRIRRQEVLFAGSWLSHKYPQRRNDAKVLFDGVLGAGRKLLIVDRNSRLGDERYYFPQQYLDFVGPGVDHRALMKLQRTVDVHVNLNSVYASPTMYANRVVELQAMGKFVLSNYSMAVNDLYPEVQLIDRPGEVKHVLDAMGGDELYRAETDGLRRVWTHDTAWQRMGDILAAVGAPAEGLKETTALVTEETDLVWAREVAAAQSHPVEVVSAADVQRAAAEFDVMVPVAPDLEYSRDHVRDLLNVFRYADVDFAAKNGYEQADTVVSQDDHELVSRAVSAQRSAIRTESSGVLQEWLRNGEVAGAGYSTAPFGAGPRRTSSVTVAQTTTYDITVVVPVYNNGAHLVSKCFRSLKRSSVFDRMEILLIDDGSTDGTTRTIVTDLATRHPNVTAHFYPEGGSGSASRPRNRGLELASAEYITYLDPDNEALNDGFATLLKLAQETGVDFAIGNMVKLSTWRRLVNNVSLLSKALKPNDDGTLSVPDDVMARTRFQPMSIQALVARTGWLREIGLHQPVGALGQDSLAFQQMLARATRIATVPVPIHVYYGAVSNSMVNTVGPGFFRKYLPLERYRKQWLETEGLLEEYCRLRVDPFFDGWLVKKFNTGVRPEDRNACRALLDELCALYDVVVEPTDPEDPVSPLKVRVRDEVVPAGRSNASA